MPLHICNHRVYRHEIGIFLIISYIHRISNVVAINTAAKIFGMYFFVSGFSIICITLNSFKFNMQNQTKKEPAFAGSKTLKRSEFFKFGKEKGKKVVVKINPENPDEIEDTYGRNACRMLTVFCFVVDAFLWMAIRQIKQEEEKKNWS